MQGEPSHARGSRPDLRWQEPRCCPLWGPSGSAGCPGTACSSPRTTPAAPGPAGSPCRPRRRSDPGPAPRSCSAPPGSARTSPGTSSCPSLPCRPRSDSAGRSQTPESRVSNHQRTAGGSEQDRIRFFSVQHTSHIKVLSSYVLISLVLTSFPWKGPKRAPLEMPPLSVNTPQWDTLPHAARRRVRPAARSQSTRQT